MGRSAWRPQRTRAPELALTHERGRHGEDGLDRRALDVTEILGVALAIDPAAHTLYTADTFHATSTVIRDGRAPASVPIGYFPWDVAVDPAAKTVYVTDNFEGRVSFFAAR